MGRVAQRSGCGSGRGDRAHRLVLRSAAVREASGRRSRVPRSGRRTTARSATGSSATSIRTRCPGYAAVSLSLKKTGVPPGDVTAEQMDAHRRPRRPLFSFGELRVSHEQNLIFADVQISDLHALWGEIKALGFATPNIGLLTNIICLPGRRFLLARERQVDPGRRGDPAALRRPRLPARHRRDRRSTSPAA